MRVTSLEGDCDPVSCTSLRLKDESIVTSFSFTFSAAGFTIIVVIIDTAIVAMVVVLIVILGLQTAVEESVVTTTATAAVAVTSATTRPLAAVPFHLKDD